ncbi:MAG: hypothetical protein KKD01_03855 [Proteobacteria bacterium]|nr:hypothetical protein [Pseudomonadota bacterium]MBU1233039.1 hypothetical protein [Pseudomonadota bacterium]MBU1418470.1 hypothetical protein [Pseudomonadota bacterium]MBU1453840.1 hypothetical protein [Pseudomonadota bacterium]
MGCSTNDFDTAAGEISPIFYMMSNETKTTPEKYLKSENSGNDMDTFYMLISSKKLVKDYIEITSLSQKGTCVLAERFYL